MRPTPSFSPCWPRVQHYIPSVTTLVAGFAVILLLVAGGCSDSEVEITAGDEAAASSISSPVGEPSPATATVAPSTLGPTDATQWLTYSSPKWGYQIKYPPGWYDLPNFGAPDSDKYFANQYVSAPLQMTKGGVWGTVRVSTSPYPSCSSANLQLGTVISQETIQMSGTSATRYVLEDQPRVVLNLETEATCYQIYFIMFEPGTRDANLPLIDAMLASFTVAE